MSPRPGPLPRYHAKFRPAAGGKGEPVDPFDDARGGSAARRRWLGALAAAAVFIVSLLVPSAGRAAPDARAVPAAGALSAANSPGELARLEACAASSAPRGRKWPVSPRRATWAACGTP